MRLVCPNCKAQYEIDDALVPAEGRDVQCSNCGHVWFQAQPQLAEKVKQAVASSPQKPAIQATADTPPETAPQELPVSPENEPEEEARALPKRELAPEVEAILREEAEFERAAREAERIESQTDLGLSDPAPKRIEHTAPRPSASVHHPEKTEFPDLSAINNSLAPAGAIAGGAAVLATRRRASFWRGFLFVITLVLIALALYALAPQIMANTPDNIDAYLRGYVDWVNAQRAALESFTMGIVDWFQNAQERQ